MVTFEKAGPQNMEETLKIALKRTRISAEAGNAAFDRLTAETKR